MSGHCGPISLSNSPAGWGMPSCHGQPVPKPRRHSPPGPAAPPAPHPRACHPDLECASNRVRASGTQSGGPRRLGLLGRSAWALSPAAKHAHSLPWVSDASLGPASGSECCLFCAFPRLVLVFLCFSSHPPPLSFPPDSPLSPPLCALAPGQAAQDRPAWPLIPAVPLLSICVNLGKSLSSPELQFPCKRCGTDNLCLARLLQTVKGSCPESSIQ